MEERPALIADVRLMTRSVSKLAANATTGPGGAD